MKKVITLIALACIGVCCVDWYINRTLRHSPWGLYKKLYQILDDTTYYDVWVLGSSRAETAFETGIISKRLQLKCFNAGIQGAKTEQIYYVLKHIFTQHPLPKWIVLDIDVYNLENRNSLLNIEQFLPFMYHSELRKNFSKIDKRIFYTYYCPVYGITFYGLRGIAKFVRCLINYPGRYDTAYQSTGCYHAHTVYQQSHYPDSTHHFNFHAHNIRYMDSIVTFCKDKNIPVFITVSPIYQSDENIKEAVRYLEAYCQSRQVIFFDFSSISDISYQQDLFSDKYHIRFNGSLLFTRIFCDSIEKHLSIKRGIR